MQEKTIDKLHNPSLKAIELIDNDLHYLGYCSEKTKQQIIDEEKTHAAEVLATACYGADIPRYYKNENKDLVDSYGVSLTQVLDNGIKYIKDYSARANGWEWELRRRQIEKNNLLSIINMPSGMACVEISSTDTTKPTGELKQWGYSGDTLVRISYKNNDSVAQRNMILKTSDIETLNMLRKHIDPCSIDVNSSEEALSSAQYVAIKEEYFDSFIAGVSNYSNELIYSNNPINYLASAIRKSKNVRNNSWNFVNNHKVFEELFDKFVQFAQKGDVDSMAVNLTRAGTWQLLINEMNQQKTKESNNYSIDDGIAKVRAIGAVFTSCGGTVSVGRESSGATSSFIDRYEIVQMLLSKIGKIGSCSSCGSTTLMYGCGVYCKSCNQIWCGEYLKSGRELSHKEVANKKFTYTFRWY